MLCQSESRCESGGNLCHLGGRPRTSSKDEPDQPQARLLRVAAGGLQVTIHPSCFQPVFGFLLAGEAGPGLPPGAAAPLPFALPPAVPAAPAQASSAAVQSRRSA